MQDHSSGTPTAILYAAKSTPDEKGSIQTQLADCRSLAQREGLSVAGEYSDESASAYSGDRGPGLRGALEHVERLAAEHGTADLWCQHSDRLARGDGRYARHLIEIVLWARKTGVVLRSVQDDATFSDLIHAVLMGERAHEDSKRKSAATQAGKRRAVERGEPVFGIRPDGYRIVYENDKAGKVMGRRMELDPEREPVYRLLWDLALQGYSTLAIVAEMDRRDYRTNPVKANHKSRPFDANRVRQTLDNPTYAGLSVYRGDVIGTGSWPAYVSPGDFERLRAERAKRGHVAKRKAGRPPERYALARVAACGECGSPMDCVTDRNVRKDGSRSRRYVCRAHRERPQDCAAKPIGAALVDRAFIANLDCFLGDVQGWHETLVASRAGEHERMAAEVARAEDDLATAERVLAAAQARYAQALANDQQDRADAIEEAITGQRAERARAEKRLSAAQSALEATSGEQSLDPLLDFYADLRTALSERTSKAKADLKRLNLVVCDYFERVELTAEADGIRVLPVLSWTAVERIAATSSNLSDSIAFKRAVLSRPEPIAATGDEQIIPPLREIQALQNPQSRW